ncbi:DMT family transporter [Synechococcus sp. PCC 6312]|uniref:DMT family transporter n=1 Tax=Synechococcus sp. (strain ATCC 27167 / PCC 6312) TaxID=195253 RepID=UPI00029F4238|nr:DMT family transporter [Synechococcus sp. PCC 6312]AFY62570.1 EamA-like transporter family [Synechococcus sp. PCC 6312]
MSLSSHHPKGVVLGLVLGLAVIAVSTAAILVRWATLATASLGLESSYTSGIGFSIFLAAGRLGIAALLLLPQFIKTTAPVLAHLWQRPNLSGISKPNSQQRLSAYGWGLMAGFCLAAHFGLWFSSLNYTSIVASTTLVTTTPIWTAVIQYLWQGKKLTWGTMFGITVACGGGLLIGLGEKAGDLAPQPLLGNGLALLAAWAVSFYFISGEQAQAQGLSIQHYTAIANTSAALILLPLPPLLGVAYGGWAGEIYGVLLLLALVPQLVGHTSLNWAIRWLSPTWVTLAVLAEPIAASVLAFWVFGERPGLALMLGGGLILFGVGFAVIRR